jgi:hypothetical protein
MNQAKLFLSRDSLAFIAWTNCKVSKNTTQLQFYFFSHTSIISGPFAGTFLTRAGTAAIQEVIREEYSLFGMAGMSNAFPIPLSPVAAAILDMA